MKTYKKGLLMKKSGFILFICVLIALVSGSGLFNNFGYAVRHVLTSISGCILFCIGVVSIYALWTKKQWSSKAVLVWICYGVLNNFIFYLQYRTGSILYPIIAVVIAAVFIKPVISRIKKESESITNVNAGTVIANDQKNK